MTQPREIPILRNGDQIRAILAGATQIRVPMNPQPEYMLDPPPCEWFAPTIIRRGEEVPGKEIYGTYNEDQSWKSPFGAPGDLLYCKETWSHGCNDFGTTRDTIHYRADGLDHDGHKWTSSVHMLKRYARIWLRVNRVWVQQVQEISITDVRAEGIHGDTYQEELGCMGEDPRSARIYFGEHWDTTYGTKFSWSANPWIVGCEFERIEHA